MSRRLAFRPGLTPLDDQLSSGTVDLLLIWFRLLGDQFGEDAAGRGHGLPLPAPVASIHTLDIDVDIPVSLPFYGSALHRRTHMLVGEAERSEVVLVDKTLRSGKRLQSNAHTQALDVLGSRYSFALTDVLRHRVAILVEGDSDLKYLRAVGKRMSLRVLNGRRVPPVIPLGGHQPGKATDIARTMKTVIGADVRVAVVLDRDYRSDDELNALERELQREFDVAHVLRRKEIENYFLSPSVVARAITARRQESPVREEEVGNLLDSITEEIRETAESQFLTRYVEYGRKERRGTDESTLNKEALAQFRERWSSLPGRLNLVSGKEVLRRLNKKLQGEDRKALTIGYLASQMTGAEIPPELRTLLRQLDQLLVSKSNRDQGRLRPIIS